MTRVAFIHHEIFYTGDELKLQRALARRMMDSVRKHIGCELVQIADMDTPSIGADHVHRSAPVGAFIPWLMEAFASQPPETIFLDTDVVVQKNIGRVFSREFDVALTGRPSRFAVYREGETVHHMPFNLGVVFSRAPGFWLEIAERVRPQKDSLITGWWGAQIELWKIWNEPHTWKLIALDAAEYNYTPNREDEDVSGKAVVHYKGTKRKHWNLEGDWKPMPEKRVVAVAP